MALELAEQVVSEPVVAALELAVVAVPHHMLSKDMTGSPCRQRNRFAHSARTMPTRRRD